MNKWTELLSLYKFSDPHCKCPRAATKNQHDYATDKTRKHQLIQDTWGSINLPEEGPPHVNTSQGVVGWANEGLISFLKMILLLFLSQIITVLAQIITVLAKIITVLAQIITFLAQITTFLAQITTVLAQIKKKEMCNEPYVTFNHETKCNQDTAVSHSK